ncbi:MAG: hypothetical protein AAF730_13180 [Bacteroidota bacterium]
MRCLALLLAALGLANVGWAQQARLFSLNDPIYTFIERLQRRGYLDSLNPTRLPYSYGAVAEEVAQVDANDLPDVEQTWLDAVQRRLDAFEPEAARWGGHLGGGLRGGQTQRLDPVRPLGETTKVYHNAHTHLYVSQGRWIAQTGLRHDRTYYGDPDGLRAAKRVLIRSEDTYLGYEGGFASFYLGRFERHWSTLRDGAPLLSRNARSFDQLGLRIGGPRLSLTSFIGELDSLTEDGRFTGRVGDRARNVDSFRRYLVAHRLDIRINASWSVALLESVLYSGPNSSLSLKYLNPLHPALFVVDNAPKNDENNGMVGALVHGTPGVWRVYGQLLMDDFDVVNGVEEASFAVVGAVERGGLLPTVDAGMRFEMAARRTYNAAQPEGKYLYLQRSLGLFSRNYVLGTVYADVYADAVLSGLTVGPHIHYFVSGVADLLEPFPLEGDPAFNTLAGPVERTTRWAVELDYRPHPQAWLRLNLGANWVAGTPQEGRSLGWRFLGLLDAGIWLTLDRPLRLQL